MPGAASSGLPTRSSESLSMAAAMTEVAHSNCNYGHFHTVSGSDSLTVCGPCQKSSRSKWCAEHVGSGDVCCPSLWRRYFASVV